MEVTWITVLVSAAISALTGTVVSLLAVSQVTVRQRRATQRAEARDELRSLVSPLLADLRKYQLNLKSSLEREAERAILDDHRIVTEILAAAAPLSWWRRKLVRRRCNHIFGAYWTQLAEDLPFNVGSDSLGAVFVPFLQAARLEADGKLSGSPVNSAIHKAYMENPGHARQERLARELRYLKEAR